MCANLNISEDADLQGLVQRSVIKTFGEDMVGIIGYGTDIINDIAALGKSGVSYKSVTPSDPSPSRKFSRVACFPKENMI